MFRPITKQDIDIEAYEAKFRLADAVQPSDTEVYKRLIRDPTTFCYLFFRLNDKPLKLYAYQDMVLNDRHRFKYFRSARQLGKSITLDVKAAINLLIDHGKGHNECIISQSLSQATYQMRRVRHLLNTSKFDYKVDVGMSDNMSILTIDKKDEKGRVKYTNALLITPPTESSLGYDFSEVNCLHYDSVIQTDRGLLKIGDIVENRLTVKILTLNHKTQKFEWKRISDYRKNPLNGRRLLRVEFDGGYLDCTENHKLFTDRGYLDAVMVDLNRKVYKLPFTTADNVNQIEINDKKRVDIEKGSTEDDRRATTSSVWQHFRGWWHLSKKGRMERLSCHDKFREADRVSSVEEENVGTIRLKRNNRKELEWRHDNPSCDNLLYGRADRDIPSEQSDNKGVSGHNNSVRSGSMVYGRRAHESNWVCCKFINSFIHKRRERNNNLLVKGEVGCSRYIEIGKAKRTSLHLIDSGRSEQVLGFDRIIPTRINAIQDVKRDMPFLWEGVLFPRFRQILHRGVQTRTTKKARKRLLSQTDKAFVYDLTIEGNHNYFANGILVHNCDEYENWVDIDRVNFYNKIISPTILHTNGNMNIFTTPNGADDHGSQLEQQQLPDGSYKFHTYVFDFFDCPVNDKAKFETATSGLTRQQIESEYLAIRSMSSRTYFTHEEIERSYDARCDQLKMIGKQPFFFLDVGSKHDQSVLVGGFIEPDEDNNKFKHVWLPIIHVYPVGYPLARVVGSEAIDTDGWHHEQSVKEYLAEWGQGGIYPTFGVDVTGNSGISPLLNAVGIFPMDIIFTGPKKSGMYQRLKYYMEKGLLHRIKSKEFEYQFSKLIMEKTDRGYLKIHHETEDDLDDVPDAVCGCLHLMDNPDFTEYSMRVF